MVELVVEQRVAADREAVWRAWTDAEAIARWWWHELPGTRIAAEARVGGAYRFDAAAGWGATGEYRALEPHDRIVLTWRWIDDGEPEAEVDVVEVLLTDEPVDADDAGSAATGATDEPRAAAQAVGTLVTVRHETREAAAADYELGWRDTLAHLPAACA